MAGTHGFDESQSGCGTIGHHFGRHALGHDHGFGGSLFHDDARIGWHGLSAPFSSTRTKAWRFIVAKPWLDLAFRHIGIDGFCFDLALMVAALHGAYIAPLIWGWLTYRVMVYDVLAEHASKSERVELMNRFRFQLLSMGVITGMMGAAPSLIWASGALFAAAFVVLIPIAVWIYTLVFIFSSLWFAHLLIQALDELRQESVL
jgi:hypothetical protein